ncbi:hypothetical protein AURDEDRAFT_188568 [Auricularia subglabra TFB-10046 SS5]|nr:hypothetical protein AURDEDRAFT_188568 [Auricularia subglabra TFB-10046 SS5]
MSLLALADETLLQIARLAYAYNLLPLSRTCKRLARICNTVRWRRYALVIRSSRLAPSTRENTLKEWSARWEKRIAHLRSKAAFVRDLVIQDVSNADRAKRGEWPDSMSFGQDLLEAALPAIQACKGLTSLRLLCGGEQRAAWPSQLWGLFLHSFPMLRSLSLEAHFVDIPCPGPNSVPKRLDTLKLHWCKGLVEDLLSHEMILATEILYRSTWVDYGPFPKETRFTPLPQVAKHLKKLDVELTHLSAIGPVFDVVPIPHASIRIIILFVNEYKFQRPPAWRRIKPRIPSLVTEDMAFYNVQRDTHIVITRPSLVEEPEHRGARQDHLCSEESDNEEQERMNRYYRARMLG